MEVVPYKAEHLERIALQEDQSFLAGFINNDLAKSLELDGWSFSGVDGNKVLICSGVSPMWEGRGLAWSYIDQSAGGSFLTIHRAVKDFLDRCPLRRIEMHVDCKFSQAHRWAGMLGFNMEAGVMSSFLPDGRDCSLYARVRG